MSRSLRCQGLSKTFPGQIALSDFDIELEPGKTHALVGQNGSGKSTFIKVLAGYHQPDAGSTATMAGEPFELGNGRAAAAAGIRFVHQDLGLVDGFSAMENISMGVGYTTKGGGRIDWKADRARAEEALADLEFHDIDVTLPVAALAPSQRTAVAIARALYDWEKSVRLLVLDEPTASLPGADVERLFAAISRISERGVAILYVSHHLDEVFAIADQVTVLRDGQRVGTVQTTDIDHDGLVEMMIGHRIEHRRQAPRDDTGTPIGLRVRGLGGGTLNGLDLDVEQGEIVGVAGITGSGREMVAKLVSGHLPSDRGSVEVRGRFVANYSPSEALQSGLAYVPVDRAASGVLAEQSVRANLTLADVGRNRRGGRLQHSSEITETADWIERLSIKTLGTENPIATLSGGNQQKVLFGRSLRLEPDVLVLDDPTQGVDVGAKEEIMQLIDHAAEGGAAVLVTSTDTDELVRLSHRVVILVGGVVAQELTGDDMTAENIERAQLQSLTDAGAK